MNKKKIILGLATIALSSGMVLTGCSLLDSNSSTTSSVEATSTISDGDVSTTLDQIDNTKWQYNEEDDVYYQIGISYVSNPVDEDEQTLSIFIPGAYMKAEDNGDGTYTCELDTDATVGNYTAEDAPIVIPINTPGYSAMSALTEYSSSAKTYTDEGFIYVSAGLRGRDSGAPAGVTDAKAAIRYLRYNQGNVAGDTESIFVFGMSGGGAQSAIIGSSGDSELYDEYLQEIGAVEGVSDAVAGVMAWCPITNLDYANEAYEWNMGSSRSDLDDDMQSLSDSLAEAYADYINQLGLVDEDGNALELEESEDGIYQSGSYYELVKEAIENSLNDFLENTDFPYDGSSSGGMMGGGGAPGGEMMDGEMPDGEMPDGEMPSGEAPTDGEVPTDGDTDTSGSSDSDSSSSSATDGEEVAIEEVDNIQRTGESTSLDLSGTYDSAQDYIDALNADEEWVKYDEETNTATISSISAFAKYMKSASKDVGAFDDLNEKQGENQLFGTDGESIHWDSTMASLLEGTEYEEAYAEDMDYTDSLGNDLQTRINMYTPLYYLLDSYEGSGTSNVAQYWRIRSGLSQGDTSVTTELNLALALQQYGIENVDFATVWGEQHTEAEVTGNSTENFIEWVNESLGK